MTDLIPEQPEEELENILVLTDENGEDVEFEYLDVIEYQDKEYILLMPTAAEEPEVVILEIQPISEEEENYLSVSDEQILNAVFAIFKDRFKDVFTFAD